MLIKEMEDNRDKLIVIMAWYTKEMEILLRMNFGIKSRIAHTIEFPVYSKEEICEIFVMLAKSNGFRLSDEAIAELHHLFEQMLSKKDEKFGNARTVRNLFENTKLHQSNRLMKETNGDLYAK